MSNKITWDYIQDLLKDYHDFLFNNSNEPMTYADWIKQKREDFILRMENKDEQPKEKPLTDYY